MVWFFGAPATSLLMPPLALLDLPPSAIGTGQAQLDPAKLIGPMLAWFMATDRAFAKLRRTVAVSDKAS